MRQCRPRLARTYAIAAGNPYRADGPVSTLAARSPLLGARCFDHLRRATAYRWDVESIGGVAETVQVGFGYRPRGPRSRNPPGCGS